MNQFIRFWCLSHISIVILLTCMHGYLVGIEQVFSYPYEIGTRGLLNWGKRHLDHQNWEELILDGHFK